MRIALTFDDGPNTTTTAEVLDVLKQYNVKASFFLIGQNINEESKKMIQREVAEGHTIECHTWTHPDMTKLSAEQMLEEINRTNDAITEITGTKPVFFRPPFICVNDLMHDTIKMPFICGQGVEDWVPDVSAEKRAQGVIDNACDGMIVLLHDLTGNVNTVEALKIFIPKLLEQGAQFMTIREIFESCKVEPYQKGKVWSYLFK